MGPGAAQGRFLGPAHRRGRTRLPRALRALSLRARLDLSAVLPLRAARDLSAADGFRVGRTLRDVLGLRAVRDLRAIDLSSILGFCRFLGPALLNSLRSLINPS